MGPSHYFGLLWLHLVPLEITLSFEHWTCHPFTCWRWASFTSFSLEAQFDMGTAGEAAAAAAAAAAPPLVEGPATAEELVESPISSLSLASLSLTTFSPLMMLHRMANMDSDILPPYTLRGFLFHKLITALKAAWKKTIPDQTSWEWNSQGYLVSNM